MPVIRRPRKRQSPYVKTVRKMRQQDAQEKRRPRSSIWLRSHLSTGIVRFESPGPKSSTGCEPARVIGVVRFERVAVSKAFLNEWRILKRPGGRNQPNNARFSATHFKTNDLPPLIWTQTPVQGRHQQRNAHFSAARSATHFKSARASGPTFTEPLRLVP